MSTFLSLLGIVGSLLMLKYREKIGETFGEAQWMRYVGGVYNAVILIAIFLFFWSIATLTNTTDLLFRPLLFLFPGARNNQVPEGGLLLE